MGLFTKFASGRVCNGDSSSVSRASARSLASLTRELFDAIDTAVISLREPDDEGPRIMVMCPALRGAFIFSREDAANRIRKAFPELGGDVVARAVRHLQSRVTLACSSRSLKPSRSTWTHGWAD